MEYVVETGSSFHEGLQLQKCDKTSLRVGHKTGSYLKLVFREFSWLLVLQMLEWRPRELKCVFWYSVGAMFWPLAVMEAALLCFCWGLAGVTAALVLD